MKFSLHPISLQPEGPITENDQGLWVCWQQGHNDSVGQNLNLSARCDIFINLLLQQKIIPQFEMLFGQFFVVLSFCFK